MTYHRHHRPGDTVAYIVRTDAGETLAVATVASVYVELTDNRRDVRYALSNGVLIDHAHLMTRDNIDAMFEAMAVIGAQIAAMPASDHNSDEAALARLQKREQSK